MRVALARSSVTDLRRTEFSRLDASGSVYLDYTGAALFPESLVRTDAARLLNTVYGNPHSHSPASARSSTALERARAAVLSFFDATPDLWDVVFTANASAAMRIIAEAFPFRTGSRLVMSADNHNSVNGLRVPALRRRAAVEYVPLTDDMRSADPFSLLSPARAPSLFAFSAQSNFSGVRHPLAWIPRAQAHGYRVLLDAAAYVPTSALSLRTHAPDFVAVSFYKMFGYPTGAGALIARRDALAELRRDYFAGGTVEFASVQHRAARLKRGAEAFEDGTPSFLALDAVADGLEWLATQRMQRVADHVASCTQTLLATLASFGDAVVVYGPADMRARGCTVAFNVRRDDRMVPCEEVERAAARRRVSLRSGCFCNPGAAEHAFAFDPDATKRCLRGTFSMDRMRECVRGPVGAVRASVGIATNREDIDALATVLNDVA